jgi:membrane protease YdiL (CAAX protease family)
LGISGPLYYFLRALMLFIGVPIFIGLANIILESQRKELIVEEDISAFMGHLKLYKMTKNNYKYQLLYGLLLLFILFIPLDFFTYLLIPEMLEYNVASIASRPTDSHFLAPYLIFIVSVIIIQVSVSIYEETLSRGFLTKRGSENYNKISAVIIASFYFGLMHFAYILNPISVNYPWYFPLIWFSQAFFIGLILSMLIIRKKWIIPAIFAHALNNIISSHAVWLHLQGVEFSFTTIALYLPLLIFSVILILWQFPQIKEGVSTGWNDLKEYVNIRQQKVESKNEILIIILVDLLIGFIIFVLGLFVFNI